MRRGRVVSGCGWSDWECGRRGRFRGAAGVAASAACGLHASRVAVLHDGPLGAGAHDFALDAASFAPGLYVVHVRVSPEAGQPWTEVRRVTVVR